MELYEQMQELDRKKSPLTPQETNLHDHIRDEIGVILDRAATANGLDSLLNDKGRAEVGAFRKRMGISVALPPLLQSSSQQGEPELHQVDGRARTTSTDAEPMMATRAGVIGAGIGAVMGIRGMVDDLAGQDSRLRHDWHAGGVQAAAGSARFATQAADATIATAAAVEGTYRAVTRSGSTIAGAVRAAGEAGPAMQLAGRVAIPLALTAGTLEAAAGVTEHDPARVAAAVGNTGGSMIGGIFGGILTGTAFGFVAGGAAGSEFGPGAVITAGVGALGGAIWGGMVGEKEAKRHLTGAMDSAMHLFGVGSHDQPHPAPAAPHPTQAAPQSAPQIPYAPGGHISPDMQRALQAAFTSNLSSSIQLDSQHHTPAFNPPMLPQKSPGAGVGR